jgi:hypothetical protein
MFARGILSFYPALFPYPHFNRASSALSVLWHSFVFRRLRTLSFFIPPLSRVSAIVCALFPKKPGVHPLRGQTIFLSVIRSPFGTRRSPLLLSSLFPQDTKIHLVSLFLPLLTQKRGGWLPPEKCRRADIFDFPRDFSRFFSSASRRRSVPAPTKEQEGWLKRPALHFGRKR